MTELQNIELNIFKAVKNVLCELKIPYYFVSGSALGSKRHKGFIPWDDDIDIAIPAYSYDLFINNAGKMLGEEYLVIGAFEQDKYPESTNVDTKVYYKKVEIETNIYDNNLKEYPWIDIFLLCGMSNSKFIANIHYSKLVIDKTFLKLSNRKSIGFNSPKKRSVLERIILYFVKRIDFSFLFNEEKWSRRVKRDCFRYDVNKSKYVAMCVSIYRWKEIMSRSIWGKGSIGFFEGIEIVVPEKIEKYLSIIYGEWSILPPEEDRLCHNVKIKNLSE